jgi:hypothetical protein
MIRRGGGPGQSRDRSLDALDNRVFGRPMGDYEDYLRMRQIATPAGDAPLGPLSTPLTQGEPSTQIDMLSGIYRLLRYLPYDMVMQLRKQLLLVSRENVPFPASGVDIALAASATVEICSIQIDESFTGFLSWVGFGVSPGTYRSSVSWSLAINGSKHPKWGNFISPADNLATPYNVMLELTRAKSISLSAKNTGLSACNVSALMIANEEVILNKPYGSTSGSVV